MGSIPTIPTIDLFSTLLAIIYNHGQLLGVCEIEINAFDLRSGEVSVQVKQEGLAEARRVWMDGKEKALAAVG